MDSSQWAVVGTWIASLHKAKYVPFIVSASPQSFILEDGTLSQDTMDSIYEDIKINEDIRVVLQGQRAVLGVLVEPSAEYPADSETFIDVFLKYGPRHVSFKYNFSSMPKSNDSNNESSQNSGVVEIPREMSLAEITSTYPPKSPTMLTKITNSLTKQSHLVLFSETSLQISRFYLNKPFRVNFTLAVSLALPDAQGNEADIRKLLEDNRYQSHTPPVIDIPLKVCVRNPLKVKTSSGETQMKRANFWSIICENVINPGNKQASIVIDNIDCLLSSTVVAGIKTGVESDDDEDDTSDTADDDSEQRSQTSEESLSYSININSNSISSTQRRFSSKFQLRQLRLPGLASVVLRPGEAFGFIFELSMSESDYLKTNDLDELIGHFLTPVTIWWRYEDIDPLRSIPGFYQLKWSLGKSFLRLDQLSSFRSRAALNFVLSGDLICESSSRGKCVVDEPFQVVFTITNQSNSEAYNDLTLLRLSRSQRLDARLSSAKLSEVESVEYVIAAQGSPVSVRPGHAGSISLTIVAFAPGTLSLEDIVVYDAASRIHYCVLHCLHIEVEADV